MQYGFLFLAVQLLLNRLKYNQDQKLKEVEKNNTKEIQREAFYRTQNEGELKKIVTEYALIITDPQKFGKAKLPRKKIPTDEENKQHVIDIMNLLIIYGSEEAILIAGILMQLTYGMDLENAETLTEREKWAQYWLAAELVTQLKSDYTGITIEPMDIIKLKISDLNDPEQADKFKIGKEYAEELIKKEQKKRN
ncbi:hypothetical protein BW727_200006 (plasmid) [Jeotgalibaca dankookensis]|uniref:Uncharacterized protein n=1 Tax=Jeotgalibaca dankookensis TaxID=708126 RepID=A0A1S6ISA0_9LACT|nr:hypothetical protein BW727_200006 [Jeotgalibaca dankookensis]